MQYCGAGTSNSFSSRRILPLLLSTQITKSSCPSSVADVSQILLPQITGDDHAFPWIATCHLMFSAGDQVTGRLFASESPCPVGPRNCGQFCSALASSAEHKNTSIRQIGKRVF